LSIQRALLSVSNKEGIVDFAKSLIDNGVELLSTGGTKEYLEKYNVPVKGISDITGFPEILDGRVKTLHPAIHGGLLAFRDNGVHRAELEENNIKPIDLVAVNLYPFKETIENQESSHHEIIENIDIGGPTMLRAAAKNYQDITVVVDPADYNKVIDQINEEKKTTLELRKQFAAKVFRHTAHYDALISQYLNKETSDEFPELLTVTYEKQQDLRYGENPHQKAAFYRKPFSGNDSISSARQLNGKELSYNNIQDADRALAIVREFEGPTVVAIKHMNPCGVGTGDTVSLAFDRAFKADPVSIFGGIIASNRQIDEETAVKMKEIFLEIIIAPAFTEKALEILSVKKNLRLLTIDMSESTKVNQRLTSVSGGLLIQDDDYFSIDDGEVSIPTNRKPTEKEWADLLFAWKVVKHIKSNAILLAKDQMTIGVGAGQMNRVGAAEIAIKQAGEKNLNAVMASDAFFPMDDTVEAAGRAGITAIIQPGGSIRDDESIKKCNEYNIAMIFTGVRHFKH
jgi:phosphoribosylaminoimidazolecarboxamide formyltransferase / IMP cyclohydrolase